MNKQKRDMEETFRCYYRPLCLYAMHYLRDMDLVEDVVQDCFVDLWERMNAERTVSGVKSYLYMMVRNRCLDTLKKGNQIDLNSLPSDLEEIIQDEEENESFLSFVDGGIATELEDINLYQGNEATRSLVNGWDIIIIRYPILKTKWSQGGYNNPNSCGKYCPNKVTGCTVTATAQLLSHFKTMGHVNWSYNGTGGSTNLNWGRIISDCGKYNGSLSPTSTPQSMDEIAHLCRYLGIAFGAKYNVDKKNKNKNSTSVGEDKPVDWFNKWGGLKATKLKKYDETSIVNAIRLGPPSMHEEIQERRNSYLYELSIRADMHGYMMDVLQLLKTANAKT